MYALGIAMQSKGKEMSSNYSLWGAIEQALFNNDQKEAGIVLHCGFAPQKNNDCTHYFAAGAYFSGFLMNLKQDKLGIYVNATEISGIKERTFELTWLFQILDVLAIQPTYHRINTEGNKTTNIGMLRLLFSIGT